MKSGLMIIICFVSCSQAGVLPTNVSASISTPSIRTLSGLVGIGEPLTAATITVINVTDPQNPQVITSTTTDTLGQFEVSLDDLNSNSIILFVAAGGVYLDPLTFQSVTNQTDILEGVWRIKNMTTLDSIDITPFSTFVTAFYTCLSTNPALAADPLDYSIATFNTVFGIDLNAVQDDYLEISESKSNEDTLYSLLNLAFARMAKEKRAISAINLVSDFAGELEEDCDLLGPNGTISSAYAFHNESFRLDYLNALTNLRTESPLSTWTENVDLLSIAANIRQSSNILFEFSGYDL